MGAKVVDKTGKKSCVMGRVGLGKATSGLTNEKETRRKRKAGIPPPPSLHIKDGQGLKTPHDIQMCKCGRDRSYENDLGRVRSPWAPPYSHPLEQISLS